MPENTSTPNEKELKERTVSHTSKEERCTLYIWDNYLVQSFRYEMGVYNQLQGTRIVLNKDSRSSRCSELEEQKNALTCQIYNEMRQNTICEFCARPRVLCSCVRLDSSIGTFGPNMNFKEDPCYFCEHLLREQECDNLLKLSKSIKESRRSDNPAMVYHIHKERGYQSPGRISARGMGETGIAGYKPSIKYNSLATERATKCCKNPKSPQHKPKDVKIYSGRGNSKKETGRCRFCLPCARPLNRCVCEKRELLRGRNEKPDNFARLSFQNQGGKFLYFPKKSQVLPPKGTRVRIEQEKDRFTEIVEKLCRSKSIHYDDCEFSHCSDCCDATRSIAVDEPEQFEHYDYESTFAETDERYFFAEKETDMDECFIDEDDSSYEQRQAISTDAGQQIEPFDIVEPNILHKPLPNQNEVIQATEQVTREEFTIKKALDDLNITVTISKQTEETTPLLNFEKSSIKYDSNENCQKSIAIEDVHREEALKPCGIDERSQLSPSFMITEKKSLITDSVAEIKNEYCCRKISSKRYVMGKVIMQSMEEKKCITESPRHVEGTNKMEFDTTSSCGCDLVLTHEKNNDHNKHYTNEEILLDSPKQNNAGFDCSIVQNYTEENREVCVSTKSPSKKFSADNVGTATGKCLKNITNEKALAKFCKDVEISNRLLQINRCTSDIVLNAKYTTKETQYEGTIIQTKSKYSSMNSRHIGTCDVSTELEFFMSQETIDRHLRLPYCIAENSMKFPSPNIATNDFMDKAFKTMSGSKNAGLICNGRENSTRPLSTKSESYVEIDHSIKSRVTFSREGNGNEIAGNFSVKDIKKYMDNRKQSLEGKSELKSEFKQTQTGGTFEQDVIASIIASFDSSPENAASRERAFRNLFNRFRGYDLRKKMSPKSVNNSSNAPKNSIVGLCLNPFVNFRSINIQVGTDYQEFSKETQTTSVLLESSSQDLSEVKVPRVFRKKFNYVCGPEGPEFKTKISMNLNELLHVNNESSNAVQAQMESMEKGAITPDQSDDCDETGEESERSETTKWSGSRELADFREASTRLRKKPCYPLDDSEEELQSARRCRSWQNRKEQIDYPQLAHRKKYEKQNNTFAAYYSSQRTFVTNELVEPFQDGIQPILNPRKIVTSEPDISSYLSQNNEAFPMEIAGENENVSGDDIIPNSSDDISFGGTNLPVINTETRLDQIQDFRALECAVNTFVKLQDYFVENTK